MSEQKRVLVNFILHISARERLVESKRQMLGSNPDFEPYVVYNRLKRSEAKGISAESVLRFLQECGVRTKQDQCQRFIDHYDTDKNGLLTFNEFLEAILPRDNSIVREAASQRDCFDIEE